MREWEIWKKREKKTVLSTCITYLTCKIWFDSIFRGVNEALYHNSTFYLHKILIWAMKKKTTKRVWERTFARDLCVRNTSCIFFPLFLYHLQWNFHFILWFLFFSRDFISLSLSMKLMALLPTGKSSISMKPYQFIHPNKTEKKNTVAERDRKTESKTSIKSHWIIEWKCLAG